MENFDNSNSIGSYKSDVGFNPNFEKSFSSISQHYEGDLIDFLPPISHSDPHSLGRVSDSSEMIYTSQYHMVAPKVEISDNHFIGWTGEYQNIPIDRLESYNEGPSQEYSNVSILKYEYDFLMLLGPYYEELECETAFRRVYNSSLIPRLEDYEAIMDEISEYNNILKFHEFLRIYEIYDAFETFTIESIKKALQLLKINFLWKDFHQGSKHIL